MLLKTELINCLFMTATLADLDSACRPTGANRSTAMPSSDILIPPFGRNQGRPFSEFSPWNKPIGMDPILDPKNDLIREYLNVPHSIYANTDGYGIPIFYTENDTPTYSIRCSEEWGLCGLEGRSVPIPDHAQPSSQSDAAMIVIDFERNLSWEFWRAKKIDSGNWHVAWGGVIETTGEGVDPNANLPTGAGIPRIAGIIRVYEMQQGRIDHALIFASNNVCKRGYRYPATKTDGQSRQSNCIMEGTRIQLDPMIDIYAIEMTQGERIIAEALQTYGAYCMDVATGAHATFIFETPQSGDPYGPLGLDENTPLVDLPMDGIRILRSWD